MRLQSPQLPPGNDRFSSGLVFKLRQAFDAITGQLNALTEGAVAAVTNADTAPPATGQHQQGDRIVNSVPTVLGSEGARYIVSGWTCVQPGTPGTWVETRAPTGT